MNCVEIEQLVELINTLRGENGCPWDKKQTDKSIAQYLLEETYELVDAIAGGDTDDICEEYGDVLFLLLFLVNIFKETGRFDIHEAARRNQKKMIRRHPHVFGENKVHTEEDVRSQWQKIKMKEKPDEKGRSILDTIPVALPALMRAYRISERVEKNGFEWQDISDILSSADRQWDDVKRAVGQNVKGDLSRCFGDFLFTLVSVARFVNMNPETLLLGAIKTFEDRFKKVERHMADMGKNMADVPRDEKKRVWREAINRPGRQLPAE